MSQCIFRTGIPSFRAASDTLNSLSTVLRSGAVTFMFFSKQMSNLCSVAAVFFVVVVSEYRTMIYTIIDAIEFTLKEQGERQHSAAAR